MKLNILQPLKYSFRRKIASLSSPDTWDLMGMTYEVSKNFLTNNCQLALKGEIIFLVIGVI